MLTGPLEPTNEPYAIAKIAGIKLCENFNRQYGTRRCLAGRVGYVAKERLRNNFPFSHRSIGHDSVIPRREKRIGDDAK